MGRRVVITGASGNIGTAVLRRLYDESGWDVTAIARREPPREQPYDRATWHRLDLSEHESFARLVELMQGADAVVHLVWAFQPTRDPAYLQRLGVDGTHHVIGAARRAGVGHVVHMSSVGAYAPRRDLHPVDEAYPHTGMPTSRYSVDKAAAERMLDDYEAAHPNGPTIARLRPGIVVQRQAGAALSRYGLPAYLPARVLRWSPVLPLDRDFVVPVVHSSDVADAVVRVLERGSGGAFNLAADEPLTRADVAAAMHARAVHVPARLLRRLAGAAWRLRLQPLSPGWIDMAFSAPLMTSARAKDELGWQPQVSARDAIAEAVEGIAANASTGSPPLRPRSAADRVGKAVTDGPVSERKEP